MEMPIQIGQRVYLVGSGEIGLTEEHDSHVYLIDAGSTWVTVDAGAGIGSNLLIQAIERLVGKQAPTHLLLTHCHADHAGGAAYLENVFGLEVFAGKLSAERILKGEDAPLALDVARAEGVYPSDYRFRPLRNAHVLNDGEKVAIGDLKFTLLATPGHSADSVCYLVHLPEGEALFCGDSLLASGLLPLLNTFDSSLSDYRATIQRLADIPFEMLFPGHGLFLKRGGSKLVSQLNRKLSHSIYIPSVITP
jgi:hydroxyacylglutathione hydrolase